jgi:glycosyltransferase involved in cell wall biosynthesis
VDAVPSFDDGLDLDDLDVVHGCGLDAAQVHECRRRGVAVALSTIYWGTAYEGDRHRRGLARRLPSAALRGGRLGRAVLAGHNRVVDTCLREVRREVDTVAAFSAADVLLPNAEGEAAAIRRDLGVATPAVVVPNGISPRLADGGGARFTDRDYVLYVGRIEPHKNQLGLIRALRGTGLRLVVTGAVHPHHAAYGRQCREEGRGWVEFTGPVPDDELVALYRGARVHAVPSWFETTGLVSLEAAVSGCSVVSTGRGHAREYLLDMAWYCDPADAASVRHAVLAAWGHPPDPGLARRVLDHYTWDHAAASTLGAYREVLDRRVGRIVNQPG